MKVLKRNEMGSVICKNLTLGMGSYLLGLEFDELGLGIPVTKQLAKLEMGFA